MKGSFAHRVLMIVGVILLLLALFAVLEVGLLGEPAQQWIRGVWYPIYYETYLPNKAVLDMTAITVGTVVPGAAGALALLRGFYYADHNLPLRLQEFSEIAATQHIHHRERLVSAAPRLYQQSNYLEPTILNNPLTYFFSIFANTSEAVTARRLARDVDTLARGIGALEAAKFQQEERVVTGLLVRAKFYLAKAESELKRPNIRRARLHDAQRDFEAVLKIQNDNLLALEGLIGVHQLSDNDAGVIQYLEQLASAADSQGRHLLQAQALRRHARVLEISSFTPHWADARDKLMAARDLLSNIDNTSRDYVLELAHINESLARVHVKRERFHWANAAYRRAVDYFASLEEADQSDSKDRLEEIQRDIEAGLADRNDDPQVAESQ